MQFKNLYMLFVRSVNVFQSTLVKPEFRLATLVGSCTAWSMEFSLMAKCPATKLSAEETIPSTRFSARPERENTFLVPCLLTWNQPLSVTTIKHFIYKLSCPKTSKYNFSTTFISFKNKTNQMFISRDFMRALRNYLIWSFIDYIYVCIDSHVCEHFRSKLET